jgi:hypothetical protein
MEGVLEVVVLRDGQAVVPARPRCPASCRRQVDAPDGKVSADGSMARLPELITFAKQHGLKIGTIADLISYRLEKDRIVECVHTADFKSHHGGDWGIRIYRSGKDRLE